VPSYEAKQESTKKGATDRGEGIQVEMESEQLPRGGRLLRAGDKVFFLRLDNQLPSGVRRETDGEKIRIKRV